MRSGKVYSEVDRVDGYITIYHRFKSEWHN